MKSNFNKTKRFAPKSNKKRIFGQSPSSRNGESIKTKPIDIEAIKMAQDKLKEQNKNENENKKTEDD
jgi:hypothetical protein